MNDSGRYRSRLKTVFAFIAVALTSFLVGRSSTGSAPSIANAPETTRRAKVDTAFPSSAASFEANAQGVANTGTLSWSEDRWHELSAGRATPTRNRTLAELLEQLASREPKRAVAIAQAEKNAILRESLVQAALRGWASADPMDAGIWAHSLLDAGERERGLAAVFSGATRKGTNEAVGLEERLVAQYPGEAVSLAGQLVEALCDAGEFEAAAHAASATDAGSQPFALGDAYARWARYQPEEAMRFAASLSDPSARTAALRGVTGGWSASDPVALLQTVEGLPPGPDRNSMMSLALQRWAKTNPGAASEWLNAKEGGAEFDAGVASVATLEALKPDVAVSWAESVVDQKLRSETLVSVLRTWATTDVAAASRYLASTQAMLPEDRQEIASLIATLSGRGDP